MFAQQPWTVEIVGRKTVVRLDDDLVRLDEENVAVFRDAVRRLAEEVQAPEISLDFGNIQFLSSTSLGILLTFRSTLLERGSKLTLVNVCPEIREVFDITNLGRFFGL